MSKTKIDMRKLAKLQRTKDIVNFVACELCCILVALIIDCLIFLGEFGRVSTPVIIISVMVAMFVGALIARYHVVANLVSKIREISGIKKYKEVKTGEVLLKVENLSQHFGPLKAVDNVSFEIKKGEVFGLVGESGCGKTTTGRTIIKLYNPTGGNVYFKGERIVAGTLTYKKEIAEARKKANVEIEKLRADTKANPSNKEENNKRIAELKAELKAVIDKNALLIKKAKSDNNHAERDLVTQIQMIFQDPIASLDPRMTVKDIISEGLIIRGMKDQAKIDEMVYNVLETVGLVREHAERYPHEFSGGQRQRIGVARAVVMSPEMIIADEPVSALDVSVQAQVINLLNDLKESLGLTILFIAHDLSVVKYFSDRIGVMYFGNLVELADADELFAHPTHPYTKSLLSAIPLPDPRTEKQRQRIKYNPIESHDYSVDQPSLREIVPGHFVRCNDKEEAEYKANYNN